SCCANLYLNSGQVIKQAGQLAADFGASISYSPSTTVACDSTSDRLLFLSSVTDGFNLFGYKLSTGFKFGPHSLWTKTATSFPIPAAMGESELAFHQARKLQATFECDGALLENVANAC